MLVETGFHKHEEDQGIICDGIVSGACNCLVGAGAQFCCVQLSKSLLCTCDSLPASALTDSWSDAGLSRPCQVPAPALESSLVQGFIKACSTAMN
jgi:hypothetical protein